MIPDGRRYRRPSLSSSPAIESRRPPRGLVTQRLELRVTIAPQLHHTLVLERRLASSPGSLEELAAREVSGRGPWQRMHAALLEAAEQLHGFGELPRGTCQLRNHVALGVAHVALVRHSNVGCLGESRCRPAAEAERLSA